MIPKFRAWSKKFKRMYEVTLIDYENGDVGLKDDHGGVAIGDIKQLILMQSTGLFDKNGVEIFEGDVVETEWFKDYEDFSGYRKRGEVVFREGYFGIRYPKDSKRYPYQILVAAIDIENIGNIYENPELLESVDE
ncbi:hypothetical protein [Streptococcus phage JX01]|uniref:YopX family protein n=1 Tax=Streptococcus agalactiae TaxID=1311 RepID=UPI00027F050E|nr:YopX family protein [Streptococcus agalactiae]AFQ95998.1 hypothetical protein [Streptococcus phage JX01]MBY5044634.1 YopX family protein [Streptococcus agalactiae]MBY5059274.1 YopX family protein [Streptococcus agalactiae]MCD0124035.1 hypothetical protein [Streptococcus agalactiae]